MVRTSCIGAHDFASRPLVLRAETYQIFYTPDTLPVKRLPGNPARTVVGLGLAHLESTQVGSFAGEVVVDRRERCPCINGLAAGLQSKVQVGGVIHVVAARRVGRCQAFEGVE